MPVAKQSFFEQNLSLETFKVIFEQNSDGALIIKDGIFVECNPAAARMLGYSDKSSIIGRQPLDFSPTLQLDGISSAEKAYHMMTLAESLGSCRFIWVHRKKDGSDIPIEVVLTRIPAAEQHFLHVAWRDTVEHKKTQQELESHLIALETDESANPVSFFDLFDIEDIQRIQNAFSEATGVASIITLPDGKPITRPSNFCRLCSEIIRKTEKGYANCCRSDAVIGRLNQSGPVIQPCLSGGLWDAGSSITVGGRHIANWLIGQVRNEVQNEEKLLQYADEIGADRKEFTQALREVTVMSKDRFEKVSNALYLFAGELSQKAYLNLLQARTIKQFQKADAALRESEEKFRALFETMTEGVSLNEIIYNQKGEPVDYRILMVNPAFIRHTGLNLSPDSENLATQVFQTSEPPYLPIFAKVAKTGEPCSFEDFLVPLDRHFNVSVISPRVGRFATVFEDITDRLRKNKDLQEKTDEMSRFTYAVSHDLKSPLVTIMTFLGYVKQDIANNDTASIEKDMSFINKATEKMSNLLEELLQLSRIGRKTSILTEVTMHAAVHEALDIVAGRIAQKKVKIVENYGQIILFGDRQRIIEVFQNLFDNAVKFMSDRPDPTIEIGHEIKGNDIILFVRDNGLGIDPRHISKLFGLFEKLNPKTDGTGIGLSLTKRIIEIHGGKIWVESEGPDKGCIFRFTLPKTRIES